MNKTVSIIVPVYNAEQYLDRCIRSILAQSYRDIEVLLINDGSTDKSGDICNKYARENRSVFIKHQENAGVSVARNNGMQQAKGVYVTFVDADDWLEDEAIEKMVRAMGKTKADIVRTRCSIVTNNGTHNLKEGVVSGKYEQGSIKVLRYAAATGDMHCYSCLLMLKRKLITKYRLAYPKGVAIMEDAWFYQDILERANTVYISDDVTYNYVVNEQGASRSISGFSEKIDSILKVNSHITDSDFTVSQKTHINAMHLGIITSMLMVRADRVETKRIREMLSIITHKDTIRLLYRDSDMSNLNTYQRLATWAVVNDKISIIICLKIIRKVAGK